MQLVGNIEDLGLGEILQIVCFSQKSGVLKLVSRKREASIVFDNGLIVRAGSSVIKEGACDLLLKNGTITIDTIRSAKEMQLADGYRASLGAILIKSFNVPSDKVDEAATSQIGKIVYSLFLWVDGSFVFELGDFNETPELIENDTLHFTLPKGINPQFLAMEGSRLLDEFVRGETVPESMKTGEGVTDQIEIEGAAKKEVRKAAKEISAEGIGKGEPVGVETVPSGGGGDTVLIVDDDPVTREAVLNSLVEKGINAVSEGQVETALARIVKLVQEGRKPLILADLFMPRMDGEGMLGGIELLTVVKKEFPDLPVIMITEHPDPGMEKEIMDLKAHSFLIKPKKQQFREDEMPEDVASFLKSLEKRLNGFIKGEVKSAAKPKPAEGSPFLMQEYLSELESAAPFLEEGHPEPRVEESKGLRLLKEMLSELGRPLSISETVLLILRFSSEIMNRAVVFAVKKDNISGLGQFGIEIKGESPDRRVKNMIIPLNEPSVLRDALQRKSTVVKSLDRNPWNDYIIKELGGYTPVESFVSPIMVQGKPIMILYGDNAPGGADIGDTSTLEIFLAQASIALERTMLEKKLSEGSHI